MKVIDLEAEAKPLIEEEVVEEGAKLIGRATHPPKPIQSLGDEREAPMRLS